MKIGRLGYIFAIFSQTHLITLVCTMARRGEERERERNRKEKKRKKEREKRKKVKHRCWPSPKSTSSGIQGPSE
jgi:hypothetical protein